ncbi:hypothetical protein RFI_13891 [Reticulomyxa filosa]|uniref:Thiamine-binding protein domain-containing protein n=1 Tax=Reticulomyxa filosa TaxID=46433 RepID=X6ND88_RETFI|nr:hypothetical protein RFI_13891 [Reticulomyxa filosa]|eukprot:ETO23292.1 hypothetical protein RFI_13891 [Reticulomyxa filosa]
MRQLAFNRAFRFCHHSLGDSRYSLALPLASVRPLHVVADICVTPLGKKESPSVSKEIASLVEIIRDSGLKSHLHACGTNVEGDWADVFDIVKKCHECLHDKGFPAVSTSIRCGTRTDKKQSLHDKVDHVEDILNSKEGNEEGGGKEKGYQSHSKASQWEGDTSRSEEPRERGKDFASRNEGAGAGVKGERRGVQPEHQSTDSQRKQFHADDPQIQDARMTKSQSQEIPAAESQWGGQNFRDTQAQESRSKHEGERKNGSIGGPLAGSDSQWMDSQSRGKKSRDPHSKTYSQ